MCRLGYPYKTFTEEALCLKECMYQRRDGEDRVSPYNLELLKIFTVNHHIQTGSDNILPRYLTKYMTEEKAREIVQLRYESAGTG